MTASRPRTPARRRLLARVALLALVIVVGSLGSAWWLTKPWPRRMGAAPADLACEAITITYAGGAMRAWLVAGQPDRGVILLLHGWQESRRRVLDRARFLVREGYAVLLPDLPAHGESPGDHVTFGVREAPAVDAALAFLHTRFPQRPLAAIGISLGAASLLMARRDVPLHAVVLESLFPTLELALNDRMRRVFGPAGPWLAPLVAWPASRMLGIAIDDVRPIDRVGSLHCPLLLLHGTRDLATPIAEAQDVFAHASEPKELWLVDGAAHEDLHAFARGDYERRVLAFLRRHLDASTESR